MITHYVDGEDLEFTEHVEIWWDYQTRRWVLTAKGSTDESGYIYDRPVETGNCEYLYNRSEVNEYINNNGEGHKVPIIITRYDVDLDEIVTVETFEPINK
tara:strand:+ start:20 stop:319 length:300 start_codon:yes stop_codon:yes gene_type:complete